MTVWSCSVCKASDKGDGQGILHKSSCWMAKAQVRLWKQGVTDGA